MENSQVLALKQEIVMTTNTPGWQAIVKLAEKVVTQMERSAIDEDDDTKGNQLRRQAKAAREFLNTFLQTIEAHRRVDVQDNSDDGIGTY